MKIVRLAVLAIGLAAAGNARAGFTVAIDTSGSGSIYNDQVVNITVTGTGAASVASGSGDVYAGINNLYIGNDSVLTPGFCIDVYRESGTFGDYTLTSLANSPLGPVGPMGAAHAQVIEDLWGSYFKSAESDSTGVTAAALQVAIWESLGDTTLNGVPLGNLEYSISFSADSAITKVVNIMLANPGNTQADLVGLVSETGQNYVIAVPEPTTILAGALMLLPFGASAVRILRRQAA